MHTPRVNGACATETLAASTGVNELSNPKTHQSLHIYPLLVFLLLPALSILSASSFTVSLIKHAEALHSPPSLLPLQSAASERFTADRISATSTPAHSWYASREKGYQRRKEGGGR